VDREAGEQKDQADPGDDFSPAKRQQSHGYILRDSSAGPKQLNDPA
jgi:hypothetical protein